MSCFRILVFLLLIGISSATAQTSTNRPAGWAHKMTLPGVANFYMVTTNLYRGAQPTAEGMKQLKAMGIKSIISLREYHSDHDLVKSTDVKSIHIEMSPAHAKADEVAAFLKAVTDTNNFPAFVHCQRGADRTGTMCALYRITICRWTKKEAIDEMRNGGFDFSPVWQNLVAFIENADIADIKHRAGL